MGGCDEVVYRFALYNGEKPIYMRIKGIINIYYVGKEAHLRVRGKKIRERIFISCPLLPTKHSIGGSIGRRASTIQRFFSCGRSAEVKTSDE